MRGLAVTTPRGGSGHGDDDLMRRLRAVNVTNANQLAEAAGMEWDTAAKVLAGTAAKRSYEKVYAWLDRMEAAAGYSEVAPAAPAVSTGPVRVQLTGVHSASYDIDGVEMVFDGNTPPEVMGQYVRALLAEIRPATPQGAENPVED